MAVARKRRNISTVRLLYYSSFEKVIAIKGVACLISEGDDKIVAAARRIRLFSSVSYYPPGYKRTSQVESTKRDDLYSQEESINKISERDKIPEAPWGGEGGRIII